MIWGGISPSKNEQQTDTGLYNLQKAHSTVDSSWKVISSLMAQLWLRINGFSYKGGDTVSNNLNLFITEMLLRACPIRLLLSLSLPSVHGFLTCHYSQRKSTIRGQCWKAINGSTQFPTSTQTSCPRSIAVDSQICVMYFTRTDQLTGVLDTLYGYQSLVSCPSTRLSN